MDIIYSLNDQQISQLHQLYQQEWWTRDRSLEQTRLVIAGSQITIGLIDEADNLVGFARVLTDYIFKAFIFDLIVREDFRHAQLGTKLLLLIKQHAKLRHVKHFELYCLPELFTYYEKQGFTTDVGAIRLMRLSNT